MIRREPAPATPGPLPPIHPGQVGAWLASGPSPNRIVRGLTGPNPAVAHAIAAQVRPTALGSNDWRGAFRVRIALVGAALRNPDCPGWLREDAHDVVAETLAVRDLSRAAMGLRALADAGAPLPSWRVIHGLTRRLVARPGVAGPDRDLRPAFELLLAYAWDDLDPTLLETLCHAPALGGEGMVLAAQHPNAPDALTAEAARRILGTFGSPPVHVAARNDLAGRPLTLAALLETPFPETLAAIAPHIPDEALLTAFTRILTAPARPTGMTSVGHPEGGCVAVCEFLEAASDETLERIPPKRLAPLFDGQGTAVHDRAIRILARYPAAALPAESLTAGQTTDLPGDLPGDLTEGPAGGRVADEVQGTREAPDTPPTVRGPRR